MRRTGDSRTLSGQRSRIRRAGSQPKATGDNHAPTPKQPRGGTRRKVASAPRQAAAVQIVSPTEPAPLSRKESTEALDLRSPEWYLNRELTWLSFAARVLGQAKDTRTPLLERVRFLALVGSHLDRFFMKRIGGLKQQVGAGVHERTIDGRTPQQQIEECGDAVSRIGEAGSGCL